MRQWLEPGFAQTEVFQSPWLLRPSKQPLLLADVSAAPELTKLRQTSFATTSVMVTPLLYGKQNMGVLALGNGPRNPPFTQSDFVVFKSIAEQSAFALYNAVIYSEANEKKPKKKKRNLGISIFFFS